MFKNTFHDKLNRLVYQFRGAAESGMTAKDVVSGTPEYRKNEMITVLKRLRIMGMKIPLALGTKLENNTKKKTLPLKKLKEMHKCLVELVGKNAKSPSGFELSMDDSLYLSDSELKLISDVLNKGVSEYRLMQYAETIPLLLRKNYELMYLLSHPHGEGFLGFYAKGGKAYRIFGLSGVEPITNKEISRVHGMPLKKAVEWLKLHYERVTKLHKAAKTGLIKDKKTFYNIRNSIRPEFALMQLEGLTRIRDAKIEKNNRKKAKKSRKH